VAEIMVFEITENCDQFVFVEYFHLALEFRLAV
jgi:hypothetical protein